MKRIAFALLVLLLATGCGAASIEVQESVPAGAVWSFSITLPGGNEFNEAKVLLDGSSIVSYYTSPADAIVVLNKDASRLFSSTEPVNSRVYFLVSPLAKGTHALKLEIDGSAADEKSVDFFEIYGAEGDLFEQLESLKGSVNSLVEQLNELEGNALDTGDMAELQASIDGIQASLAGLESEFELKGGERDVKIEALNGYLQQFEARESEKELQASAGFFSMPSIGQGMLPLLLIAVIAIAAIFLVAKFRDRIPIRKGLYGNVKIKAPSFSKYDNDITEQAMKAAQREGPEGKWAFEDEAHKEEAHKGFGFGDLIRK